jgi:nucleotide-binding universal stress UspA family protein
MLKDIVVNLALDTPRDVATHFAISVAAAFDANLTGIAFLYQPLMPMMVRRHGMPPDLLESQRIENEKAAIAAAARFDAATRRSALSAEARMVDAPVPRAPGLFASIARRFDLAMIAQPQPNKPALDRLIVEAALFDSGRPAFIVPHIQRAGLKLDRVLVGWDGSRSAARAVADAMPFLMRAKATEIIIVASEAAKSDEIPDADIARHLARHGVKAEVNRMVSTETDVAGVILSRAADASADLLVIGGYGHSRLREFVLGGTTRGMLNSMTVPTLMSH